MSRQFAAGKKKKTTQAGIVGFCERRPNAAPIIGERECPYCFGWFSPQGYPNHIIWHQLRQDKIRKKPKYGPVRVRTDLMSRAEIREYEATRAAREGAEETAAIAARAGVIALDDSDDDEGRGEGDDDRSASAGDGHEGGGDDDTGGRGSKRLREDDDDDDDDSEWEEGGAGDDDDEDANDDEEAGPATAVARQRNWHPTEIVKVLKDFDRMNGRSNLSWFARYVQRTYGRPKFQRNTLKEWLKKREQIEESARKKGSDRRSIAVPRQRVGQYPEMEARLAERIHNLRDFNYPVHTWMVEMEGKALLHELFPKKFPQPNFDSGDDEPFPFKFSRTWMDSFFRRFGFSRRTIGTKMNKKGVTAELLANAEQYHMRMRALQLSEINDPVYGLTSPHYVYSHDQVPIELCPKRETTVDTKGATEIYDGTSKSSEEKRFCTLNLSVPMDVLPDGSNVPKPHLVFNGTSQSGDQWHDASERGEWDPDVVVSFQEKAWVDTDTHIYGLTECFGQINSHLEENGNGLKGLVIEDNLSVHHTARSLEHWRTELPSFLPPQFLPANMTLILQVIDRHIGIQYKQAVYLDVRKKMMKLLQAARKEAGGVNGVTVPALTPREKRILITKAIGACHRRLVASGLFKRAFTATGTWMPIQHLLENDESGAERPSNAPEDAEVKLQHLSEYKYAELFKRDRVRAAVERIREAQEQERVERERRELERNEALEKEADRMRPFAEKAEALMADLYSALKDIVAPHLELIRLETGFDEFLVGGSWASAMIAKAVATVCESDSGVDACALSANDVDIYHGSFAPEPGRSMVVHMNQIAYKAVEGFEWEINTVKCDLLSAQGFLDNNDLNVTASCLHVDFANDDLLTVHASPCFWELVFENSDARVIRTAALFDDGQYGAKTFVRMAFKSMELGIKCSYSNIEDLTRGKIAQSHKEKLDKMATWVDSPFNEYKCNSCSNHTWVLKKKHDRAKCVRCTTAWSNGKCSHKMCKKCCVEHTAAVDADACKVKSHR